MPPSDPFADISSPAPVRAIADDIAGRYVAAVLARDVAAFMSLYDERVLIFDAWNRFSLSGAEAWRAAVSQWLGSLGTETVEASVQLLACHGDERLVGICACVTYGARTPGGELLHSLDNRLSWLVVPQAGRWRIVHEHTSLPVDETTFKGVAQRPPDAR